MWFMDFLTAMFKEMIAEPKLSYPKCVRKAYNEALGIHHELIYRLAAQAGFLVAPGRDVFYLHYCGDIISFKYKGFNFEIFRKK